MIYILVFLFLLSLTIHFDIQNNNRGKLACERWMITVLILFSALRNEVGSDTFVYEYQYRYYPTLFNLFEKGVDWDDISQPLWVLLNCLFKTISNDFVYLQAGIAIFFNLLLYNFFKNISKKVFACFLLLYCTKWYDYNFEILRESLSVVIYLTAIVDYIKNKSLFRYFIICIPAIFIHWFAFAMIFLTPIMLHTKKSISFPIATILGVVTIFWGGTTIVDAFNYVSLFVEGDKALSYLSEWNTRELTLFIIIVQGLLLRVLLPFIIIIQGNEDIESQKIVILKRILVLYVLIGGMSTHVIIAYRLLNYMYPILVVLAVEALNQSVMIKRRHLILRKKHAFTTYILSFCLFSLIVLDIREFIQPTEYEFRSGINYDCRYFPYTSIFEKKDEVRSHFNQAVSHAFDEKVFGE